MRTCGFLISLLLLTADRVTGLNGVGAHVCMQPIKCACFDFSTHRVCALPMKYFTPTVIRVLEALEYLGTGDYFMLALRRMTVWATTISNSK